VLFFRSLLLPNYYYYFLCVCMRVNCFCWSFQDKSLYSKDHSTEYLWAFKVLSAKDRYLVTTDGLNESEIDPESIYFKFYISLFLPLPSPVLLPHSHSFPPVADLVMLKNYLDNVSSHLSYAARGVQSVHFD